MDFIHAVLTEKIYFETSVGIQSRIRPHILTHLQVYSELDKYPTVCILCPKDQIEIVLRSE